MARDEDPARDPRSYLAAERTFLAWIRTGLALMGFGFVVARFGVFLREIAAGAGTREPPRGSASLFIGVALITVGVAVHVVAAVRHRRYVSALDEGRFRHAFGSAFATALALLLAAAGIVMALALARP